MQTLSGETCITLINELELSYTLCSHHMQADLRPRRVSASIPRRTYYTLKIAVNPIGYSTVVILVQVAAWHTEFLILCHPIGIYGCIDQDNVRWSKAWKPQTAVKPVSVLTEFNTEASSLSNRIVLCFYSSLRTCNEIWFEYDFRSRAHRWLCNVGGKTVLLRLRRRRRRRILVSSDTGKIGIRPEPAF